MRRRSLVAAGAVVLGASVLAGPPAQAATTFRMTIPDGVVYAEGCQDHAYTYIFDGLPAGYSATLNLTLLGPDGLRAGADSQHEPSGTGSFFFCSSSLTGVYTARGTAEICQTSSPYSCSSVDVERAFSMRKPHSRTGLSAPRRVRPGREFEVKVTVRDERPNGYFPTDYTDVYLEQRGRHGWQRVPHTMTTVYDGRTFITVTMTGPKLVLRAVKREGSVEGSVSRRAVVRPKAGQPTRAVR